MIPDYRLSTTSSPADFLGGRALVGNKLLDYETGGIGLNDASQGIDVQIWRGRYIGLDIVLDVPDNPEILPITVLTIAGSSITEFSFTFDQLMNPIVAYVQGGESKLNFYDSSVSAYVTVNYGTSVSNPRLSFDDKRDSQLSESDVIFAYIENNSLYFRAQRDRFLTAYLLQTGVKKLQKIGMNVALEMQFNVVTV